MAFEAPMQESAQNLAEAQRPLNSMLGNIERLRLLGAGERALLAALLDQPHQGIIVFDGAGRVLLHNVGAERMLGAGTASGWLSDRPVLQAFHPDGRPLDPSDWLSAQVPAGEGALGVREIVVERLDGTRRVLTGSASPLLGADGERIGCIATFMDITAQKEREAAALALEQRARAEAEIGQARSAFLSEAAGVLASSLDYEATLASVARLAVPGMADWCCVDLEDDFRRGTPATVVAHADPSRVEMARELQQRFPPDPAARSGVAEVLRTGRPEVYADISEELLAAWTRSAEELAALRSLGHRSAMIVPMSARGRVLGAISLFSTQFGRRYGPPDLEMAQHLARRAGLAVDNARLYREAQAAVLARDEVLAFVSHDLKNPLSAVLMGAAMLERASSSPHSVARHAGTIRRSAERMDRLIRDLLDLSSLDAGRLSLDIRPLDGNALLSDSAALLDLLAVRKDVRVTVQMGRACHVLGDRERILRVLSNLIGNAIAFTPPGGAVTLGCEAGDGSAVFSVSDNGVGIPQEDRAHVFDRFWKSRDSRSGSGLGLAIARGLVEAHRGRIWLESSTGAGTTFSFSLPYPDSACAPGPEARDRASR